MADIKNLLLQPSVLETNKFMSYRGCAFRRVRARVWTLTQLRYSSQVSKREGGGAGWAQVSVFHFIYVCRDIGEVNEDEFGSTELHLCPIMQWGTPFNYCQFLSQQHIRGYAAFI